MDLRSACWSTSLSGKPLRRCWHRRQQLQTPAPLAAPVRAAREPPPMRSLRSSASGSQPQYGSSGNGMQGPRTGMQAPRTGGVGGVASDLKSSKPLYRGNLSGPGTNLAPTTAARPEDVLAANPAASPQATAATATASKPIVKFVPKSVSLFDAFKFNGPAPEIIQGRLAMVGFLAGAITEAQTGETLLQQATQLSPGTIAWLLLIVVASLQPITKAAKSEPFGWFTPRAEITNGRAAMLAFAIIAALEWNAGVCFF